MNQNQICVCFVCFEFGTWRNEPGLDRGIWGPENAINYIICYIYIAHHILVGIDLETLKLDHVLNDVRIVRL